MSESLDLLEWLQRWYQAQCDGDWEHECGIRIESLDNPGWLIKADLRGMDPAKRPADRVLVALGESPCTENGKMGGDVWMMCEIKSGQFVGAGDPTQLQTILAQFRKLVEEGCV